MESQLELYDMMAENRVIFQKEAPGAVAVNTAQREEILKDGALSHKVKRLIALGVALRTGCTRCLISQTKSAVEAGATKEEVLEAVSVAIAMGGTPAIGWSWRVFKVLEELGKW